MEKVTWQIKKIKRIPFFSADTYEVQVKANAGRDEVWMFTADDELGAWLEAEKYIRKNYP
jgi:hypothetical protein